MKYSQLTLYRGWVCRLDDGNFILAVGQQDSKTVAVPFVIKPGAAEPYTVVTKPMLLEKNVDLDRVARCSQGFLEQVDQGLTADVEVTLMAELTFEQCPICKNHTLPETAGNWDCPICGWKDIHPELDTPVEQLFEDVPRNDTDFVQWLCAKSKTETGGAEVTRYDMRRLDPHVFSKANNMTPAEAQANFQRCGAVNESHRPFVVNFQQFHHALTSGNLFDPTWLDTQKETTT